MEMIAMAIFMMVASYVITAAVTPPPGNNAPDPALFEDIDFPQVAEGTPQMVVFGDCWIKDWTVLAVGDYRTKPIKTKSGK